MLITIVLAAGMFFALEVGRRIGLKAAAVDPHAHQGTGPIEGAVFGLIGLILAFSFSGAQARFAARSALVVEEANAIATAHERASLLPESHRAAVRELIRDYLDERIAAYLPGTDHRRHEAHRGKAMRIQHEIWTRAELGCRTAASSCASLLLPAVDEMRAVATARTAAQHTHVAWLIVVLMCVLATCGAALAGYALAAQHTRRWLHWALFVVSLIFTVFVILDLDHPRRGLIRLQAADTALTELRDRIR